MKGKRRRGEKGGASRVPPQKKFLAISLTAIDDTARTR